MLVPRAVASRFSCATLGACGRAVDVACETVSRATVASRPDSTYCIAHVAGTLMHHFDTSRYAALKTCRCAGFWLRLLVSSSPIVGLHVHGWLSLKIQVVLPFPQSSHFSCSSSITPNHRLSHRVLTTRGRRVFRRHSTNQTTRYDSILR